MISVCETKAYFDSEWEANQAALRAEDKFGEEMEPYRCSQHWHITHKKQHQRRGAGYWYAKCPNCGDLIKRSKMSRHKC